MFYIYVLYILAVLYSILCVCINIHIYKIYINILNKHCINLYNTAKRKTQVIFSYIRVSISSKIRSFVLFCFVLEVNLGRRKKKKKSQF